MSQASDPANGMYAGWSCLPLAASLRLVVSIQGSQDKLPSIQEVSVLPLCVKEREGERNR